MKQICDAPVVVAVNQTKGPDDYEQKLFEQMGASYRIEHCADSDEVAAKASDAQVILFAATPFDRQLLERLPRLKLLVRYGVGYDNVDIAAARELGIGVCNSPAYGSYDVAEHAFALLMDCNRRLTALDRKLRRQGQDDAPGYIPLRLEGKTLGVLGFGRIGSRVGRFSTGFSMNLIACDPYIDPQIIRKAGGRPVDLDTLLREADFLSINTPLTDETRGLFDQALYRRMKPSAVLVNTARGAITPPEDLLFALKNGLIRAAGIDVYDSWPSCFGPPERAPENLVITPHEAWHSAESVVDLHREAADEAARFFRGERLVNLVNG